MSNVETVTETPSGASPDASETGLGVRLRQDSRDMGSKPV